MRKSERNFVAAAPAPCALSGETDRRGGSRLPGGVYIELPDQAVYIDSPIMASLRQILPYFDSGMFDRTETPVYLHIKSKILALLAATRLPAGLDIRNLRGRDVAKMPLGLGAVVFYPFNSQSNMNTVTNRAARHILTLHGESNKIASSRPAARLYDYVSVAGPLARDRYLAAGIFTKADVNQGRLVMMGDSFVQDFRWITPAAHDCNGAALLYSPTWEGYGNGSDNYTSIAGGRGFAIVAEAARAVGVSRIVIKPHPYLGLLQPRLLCNFAAGVRQLRDEGFRPELALEDANLPMRMLSRSLLLGIPCLRESADAPLPVALALCDVSGMEAVFLKARIAHMVIVCNSHIPATLQDIYHKKALFPETCTLNVTQAYLDEAPAIDAIHRALVFGWTEPELAARDGAERRNWLLDYVRRDPFWRGSERETKQWLK